MTALIEEVVRICEQCDMETLRLILLFAGTLAAEQDKEDEPEENNT